MPTNRSADFRPTKPGKQGERFMYSDRDIAKFLARHQRLSPDECWPWEYHAGHAGHGRMWANGRNTLASHIALHLDGRPRLNDAAALHSCDNPNCVNPRHLRWGTQLENITDRVERGRNGAARGVENGRAKLSEDQVINIREDARSSRLIAPEYGISQAMVCNIKARRAWRHVDSEKTGEADMSRMQRGANKQAGSLPFSQTRRPGLDLDVSSLRLGRSDQ